MTRLLDDRPPPEGTGMLVAAGTQPRSGLAADAGLESAQDRVVVDERMRSSVPAVLAAGDVAYARNAIRPETEFCRDHAEGDESL